MNKVKLSKSKKGLIFSILAILTLISYLTLNFDEVGFDILGAEQEIPGTNYDIPYPTQNFKTAIVSRVIDGDTIELENGEIVRYIGIDTPELKAFECMSSEAMEFNRNLVEGKSVKLVKDVSETDRYSRLLRYVWVDDVFVNEYLVRLGYAQVATYPPDVKYQDLFRSAQNISMSNELGFWSKCK